MLTCSTRLPAAESVPASSCIYVSVGRDSRFFVVCLCCDGSHGPLDSRTKRPMIYPSRRAANRVASALNAVQGGTTC